jgi:hypothetical protein
MLATEKKTLNRSNLLNLLDRLEKLNEPAVTLYLPVGFQISDYTNITGLVPGDERIPEDAYVYAGESATGAVLFWGESIKCLVIPPFALSNKNASFGYEVENLRQLLGKQLNIAIVIVRLGYYGIALYKGVELITSKVGTGLVHARHKKGGSSQHRFERHRDKQIEYFYSKVCLRSREKLEPYLKQIDCVFYGGEKRTVGNFIKQCNFMRSLADRAIPRLLNVSSHGQQSLGEAINKVWSCQVIEWHNSGDTATL